MILKFKNKHICWCLASIWSLTDFDYKFKTHINQLFANNSDDEFEQDVNISKEILVDIYQSASRQPEGVAASINKDIKNLLLPQLLALSNNDINNPNEAFSAILSIQALDAEDIAARDSIIAKTKTNILN